MLELTNETLQGFDNVLRSSSYISGPSPTQADVKLFKAMTGPPEDGDLANLHRWYGHITTYRNEFALLPGDPNIDLNIYLRTASAETASQGATAEDDGEEIDLFGGDEEEDEEAAKAREERLREYQARKATKPKPTAKTMVTLDIKPWDDETPMGTLEVNVRGIEKDGLLWGQSQLVDIGYGIKKLQINVIVEDEKVSVEDLRAEIEEDEDHVQSTDIAAMSKL